MRTPLLTVVALATMPLGLAAQQSHSKSTFEVYGFAMMDAGYNSKQSDPDWFDTVRPTKLPSFTNEFGADGNAYFSVRQTRFGIRTSAPTTMGELKTVFEFELFGVGVDAGQTTIRLRHAYGELGHWGAGQYWSPFMDIDVFPNSVEYWGPNGMAFFRNVQVRWMPIKGDTRLTVALERPGASADQGIYADRVELADVKPRFPLPDLSAEYRRAAKWGYVELAGIVRSIKWEDLGNDAFDLSGDALGWGLSLSSNVKLGKPNIARLQLVYGDGIENYMNDAPVDIGIRDQPGNPVSPVKGVALPVLGVTAFVDHTWNAKFASTVGYSMLNIENTAQQLPSEFHRGQYALANVAYTLVPGVTAWTELQWANRENRSDGFKSDVFRVQFSFKYNFSRTF